LAATSARAQEPPCPPFDEPRPVVLAAGSEPGLAPEPAAEGGAIVSLPESPSITDTAEPGEALLALQRRADGSLPSDFELAPGARIAESYFSPLLCATVARVVGPPDALPSALVPVVPDTAAVVPNSVYVTTADEVAQATAPAAGPDPHRSLQYGLDHAGVDRARSLSTGSGARIAVLDSAPDVGHRDLAGVSLEAIGRVPGAAAVHGSLISGIVAAGTGNGFGMAGLAPGASVLALAVCTPAGATARDRCVLYDLLRGADRAWERESQVVNLSVTGPANPLLERSLGRLDELGVLIVASAGNESTADPRYPAAYPSVIGVGAADRDRRRYARSNTGISAELLAPGVEILSAVPGEAFAFGSGTSFAAAHVSGVLAVLIGAGVEPGAARTALFQQASSSAREGVVLLPTVCDVLARLGRSCPP
jgi:subtilisin family serine protease